MADCGCSLFVNARFANASWAAVHACVDDPDGHAGAGVTPRIGVVGLDFRKAPLAAEFGENRRLTCAPSPGPGSAPDRPGSWSGPGGRAAGARPGEAGESGFRHCFRRRTAGAPIRGGGLHAYSRSFSTSFKRPPPAPTYHSAASIAIGRMHLAIGCPARGRESFFLCEHFTTKRLALVLGLICVAGLASADEPPAAVQDRVGGRTACTSSIITCCLPSRGQRSLRARIVYPDAEGPFPLVVYSHGFGCYREELCGADRSLGLAWLRGGVAGASRLPDLGRQAEPGRCPQPPVLFRISDVGRVLDALFGPGQEIPGLTGRIDYDRKAIAGHSFGGMIAQVIWGQPLKDLAQYGERQLHPRFRCRHRHERSRRDAADGRRLIRPGAGAGARYRRHLGYRETSAGRRCIPGSGGCRRSA